MANKRESVLWQGEDTLIPPGQGYANQNYHEMSVSFFLNDSQVRFIMSLETGWILSFTSRRASKLQAYAVNKSTHPVKLLEPHSSPEKTTAGKCTYQGDTLAFTTTVTSKVIGCQTRKWYILKESPQDLRLSIHVWLKHQKLL